MDVPWQFDLQVFVQFIDRLLRPIPEALLLRILDCDYDGHLDWVRFVRSLQALTSDSDDAYSSPSDESMVPF